MVMIMEVEEMKRYENQEESISKTSLTWLFRKDGNHILTKIKHRR